MTHHLFKLHFIVIKRNCGPFLCNFPELNEEIWVFVFETMNFSIDNLCTYNPSLLCSLLLQVVMSHALLLCPLLSSFSSRKRHCCAGRGRGYVFITLYIHINTANKPTATSHKTNSLRTHLKHNPYKTYTWNIEIAKM